MAASTRGLQVPDPSPYQAQEPGILEDGSAPKSATGSLDSVLYMILLCGDLPPWDQEWEGGFVSPDGGVL